jgi:F-type H+-transporting ATPase subunit a
MINTNSNLIVSQFTISSPLDQFEVTNLIGLNAPILGYLNLSLTNLGLYSLIVLAVILSLHVVTTNNNKIIPSK